MSSKTKSEQPSRVTYYVVQAFRADRRGLMAEEPIAANNADHARRLFEKLKTDRAGVIAFSRSGCPAMGDWDDAVIIYRHGEVAAEVDLMEPYEPDPWEMVA